MKRAAGWQNPNLQRWLNRDPIQELGGLNLYEFVYSDPLKWVDMFGLGSVTVGCGTGSYDIKKALEKLKKTKHGKKMIKEIEKSDKDVVIVPAPPRMQRENDFHYDPKREIIVVPSGGIYPSVTTTAGDIPISLPSLIAHELGHAIGANDDGPGAMNNVNANENPVRDELGEPRRTKYPLP